MNVDAINTARRIIVCAQNIIEKQSSDIHLKTPNVNIIGDSRNLVEGQTFKANRFETRLKGRQEQLTQQEKIIIFSVIQGKHQ